MNIKKNKIKKYFCGTLALATIGVYVGLSIEDSTQHENELCPFSNVLGYSHQAKKINDNVNFDGYAKYYKENEVIDPIIKYDRNGRPYYTTPAGYRLVDGKCVPIYETSERVHVYTYNDGKEELVRVFTKNK